MRASLRATYGVDLSNPGVAVTELAELTMWLPPGSPLWVSIGGPRTWSAEQRVLNMIEFRLRVLDWRQAKGARPEPLADPPYAAERVSKEQTEDRKIEAYRRRHNLN